jgi:hypothetical protein
LQQRKRQPERRQKRFKISGHATAAICLLLRVGDSVAGCWGGGFVDEKGEVLTLERT